MKLQQIYDLGIKMGIQADPRGESFVKKLLAKVKKEYEDLPEKKKRYFDKESMVNPYADSRLYFGDPDKEIKKVIVGIDADSAEVVLADRLNDKGMGIDAIITHHPHGQGLAGLYELQHVMTDIYSSLGVPENVADAIMTKRAGELKKRLGGPNHYQTIDVARLLNMPFMSLHTTWDNQTFTFLRKYVDKKLYDNLGELLEYMREIPEFESTISTKVSPQIVAGSEKSRVGKIAIEATGGTNPSKDIYAEAAKAGVGTLIQMHIPDDALKEMQKYHMNAIDIGHIAADSIGANLFLDELEKQGVDVITFGGLVRVKRN